MSKRRPDGANAIMANRAPDEVEADDPLTALYRAIEFFPTPPWGARAGAEILRLLDPAARTIWEPACGEGHMAAPLAEYFDVFASDIHPFGFGEVADFLDEHDSETWVLASADELPERFTDPRCDDFRTVCSNGFVGGISVGSAFEHKPCRWPQCFPHGEDGDAACTTEIVRRVINQRNRETDWIVTNPPFKTAAQFLRLGLRRARRGVALLLRLQFLEGGGRYPLLFGPEPMTRFAVFAERLPMTLGRWDPEASTATGYAWFFWMKGAQPLPPIGIPPGTRARLSKPDDAARFGWRSEAALLELMEAAPCP